MEIIAYLFFASAVCFIGYKAYVMLLKKETKKSKPSTGGGSAGGGIIDDNPREDNGVERLMEEPK